MARDNKQGQSDRYKKGEAFQQDVFKRVETFLETENLDPRFRALNMGRNKTVLPNGKIIRPDIVVRSVKSQKDCIRFGCKSSFRERWKQDDYEALKTIMAGAKTPWIEVTERERPTASLANIRKNCASIQQQSEFDIVVSTLDPDRMNEMFKNIKQWLLESD